MESRPSLLKELHVKLVKHKDIIFEGLDILDTDTCVWFCFVKFLNCNAADAISFSNAWCRTLRNIDSDNQNVKGIAYFSDLFNFKIIQSLLHNGTETISVGQNVALERLAEFLEKKEEINKIVADARGKRREKEFSWAAILGIHVLKNLSVSQKIIFDEGYSDKYKYCPCTAKCLETLQCGDTSMGNEDVWHGSVDIIIGDTAYTTADYIPDGDESENLDVEFKSAFELNSERSRTLEEFRSQLIAQTVTVAFLLRAGLTPLVSLSYRKLKVFMYDKQTDLLLEGCEMPLFDSKDKFIMSTVLALWFIVNYREFCTGVSEAHVKLGFTSDFKLFLESDQLLVYENNLQWGQCKHAKRHLEPIDSSKIEPGTFKRIKLN